MKKRLSMLWLAAALAITTAWAIPARPGIWQTLRLADGSEVKARLVGDEFGHYWQTADGRRLRTKGEGLVADLLPSAPSRPALNNPRRQQARRSQGTRRQARLRRADEGGSLPPIPVTPYLGQKRGLIILAEFADRKFRSTHNQQLYKRIANEEGFTSSEGFRGSVRDYFLAQSGGSFDLSFDVAGPVTLQHGYAYYGNNVGDYDEDEHAGEMVAEACLAIADTTDFSPYDWDGDGEVDQVMIIYAGRGEHAGGGDNTIWPHEYQLQWSDYGQKLSLGPGQPRVDTYACSCELGTSIRIDGIGTICHEFSHCLGLPDYYDVYYNEDTYNYGLGSWSLMSGGSYNGNSFCPAGYTSLDRWMCGWLTPTVLSTDTTIVGQQPLSEGGEAYLLCNDAHPQEFYLLENRQLTGWDAKLPGAGLLVLHVDYDQEVWWWNEPNATSDTESGNDHQRCTILHADNSTNRESGDPYPYTNSITQKTNDSITPTSRPSNAVYNPQPDGSQQLLKSVLAITRNDDATMSFTIRIDTLPTDTLPTDTLSPDTLLPDTLPAAIRTPRVASPTQAPAPIFSLQGHYLGTDPSRLPPGLYIQQRRKLRIP